MSYVSLSVEESIRAGIEFRKGDIERWNEIYKKAIDDGDDAMRQIAVDRLAELKLDLDWDLDYLKGGCKRD